MHFFFSLFSSLMCFLMLTWCRGHGNRGATRGRGPERLSYERHSNPSKSPVHDRRRSSPTSFSIDNTEYQSYGQRNSTSRDSLSDNSDYSGSLGSLKSFGLGSVDMSSQALDFSSASVSPRGSSASQSSVSEFGYCYGSWAFLDQSSLKLKFDRGNTRRMQTRL